jgi:tetratricopeptide (TPR) repeat protein
MSESNVVVAGTVWGGGQGIAATAKYNPHLWSAEELRAIFVVRQRELASILEAVRAVPVGGVPQHMLITGQRGMGKSTLLQRVALAVAEDAQVNQTWLALRFPEEQYTVSTPGELWSNVIGALADTLERQGVPIEAIDFELVKLGQVPQAQREELALAWLEQWCQQHQKRLLLLMDSTDLLFSNLASAAANKRGNAPDGGASALWRVRKVLLHSPHFFWLGGSYQPLEADGLYSDAFLDFFQLIELRPLTLPEMQTAILALARTFGVGRGLLGEPAEQEIKRMLAERPERLRAIRQLTGGNPRTTVTVYELFVAGGQESVRSDLERMLDVMTPLYKAKLETLADQMRKILVHVMESWAPISAKGLADVSGIAVGVVSTQLVRLEQEGLVEKVCLRGKKRQGYQVVERFFNIWYLMRNAPRNARVRMGWLVSFMHLWYGKGELQDIAKSRRLAHRNGTYSDFAELEYSHTVVRTMPKIAQERQYLDWAVFKHGRKSAVLVDLFDQHGDDSDYSTPDNYLARLDSVRIGLRNVQLDEPEKSVWVREVMASLYLTLAKKEKLAKACQEMSEEQIAAVRQNVQDQRGVLISWYGEEGISLLERAIENGDFFPDCPDLQLALIQIETCFSALPGAFAASIDLLTCYQVGDAVELACKKAIEVARHPARLWYALGRVIFRSNKRHGEVEAAFRKAIELSPKWARPWEGVAILLKDKLNRYEDAEVACRNGIKYGDANPLLHANLGRLMARLKRGNEATEQYRLTLETASNEDQNIRLQAHCWLGNNDLALQALDALAEPASKAEGDAFEQLREQCYEIHTIGQGNTLRELMERSTWAGFLQPFALALCAANGEGDALLDAPAEIRSLAEEILLQITS